MKQMLVWLALGLLVLGALAPAATAAEKQADSGWKFQGTAPQLRALRQVLGWLALSVCAAALVLGTAALTVAARALLPARVGRAARALERGPWKALLLGVPCSGALLLLTVAFTKVAEVGRAVPALPVLAGLLAMAVFGLLLWLVFVGLAGTASMMGRRLVGEGASPWRSVGAGALALSGALLVPIVGWLWLLYIASRGVGAAILTLFAGAPPASPAVASEAAAEEADDDDTRETVPGDQP